MVSRWQEGFSLGGLGGLPFAGKSGFRAFLHHVPDSGRLLVLFAPHGGIDAEGRVGALQRDGQVEVSKACGAAVGASIVNMLTPRPGGQCPRMLACLCWARRRRSTSSTRRGR